MTPTEVLARTLWGEARGEGQAGMQAVASVVLNRVMHPRWWGHDIMSVCLAPMQFSCWNGGDDNNRAMKKVTTADKQYLQCLDIAGQAVAFRLSDNVLGATTYKTVDLPWPRSWGDPVDPLITIRHHAFFNLDTPHQPTKGHPQ